MQKSTQLSLITFLLTLAALPTSDTLAATTHPGTESFSENKSVDARISRLSEVFEQRAGEVDNLVALPSELNLLLAGFANGGFRNGGFVNGGGFNNGGFVNSAGFRWWRCRLC